MAPRKVSSGHFVEHFVESPHRTAGASVDRCWLVSVKGRGWSKEVRHAGPLTAASELLVVVCGIWFPGWGSNPGPCIGSAES